MSVLVAMILAAAGPQEDDVVKEALSGFKMPWSGFAAGSSVTYHDTLRRPEISADGKLVYKDEKLVSTWSLDGGLGEPMKLKIKGEGRESVIDLQEDLPDWTKGKGETQENEKLTVGEKSFDCTVTTITFAGAGDAGRVATIYRSAEAPTWAVRRLIETFVQGKRNTREEEVLVGTDEKLRVGEREVVCQKVRVTLETPGGAKTVHLDWRSDEVPGRLVRRETRFFQGERELPSAFTKKEVVRFSTRK